MSGFIEFTDVKKVYGTGEAAVHALDGISFSVDRGEFVVILGASGAGKTTLLNMLGGMDTVTSGRIMFDGREVSAMSRKELVKYRRFDVGFVFQFYNLILSLTALENVEIAAMLCRDPIPPEKALDMVGLSGCALAKNPSMLLCDEPTGALDDDTGKMVLKILHDLGRERHTTVLLITHNQAIAPMADRIIRIRSGRIVSNEINQHVIPVEQIEW